MSDPMEKLLKPLAQIKKCIKPKYNRIKNIFAITICPIWGLVGSALLFNVMIKRYCKG
jgi:hypothetical protein